MLLNEQYHLYFKDEGNEAQESDLKDLPLVYDRAKIQIQFFSLQNLRFAF